MTDDKIKKWFELSPENFNLGIYLVAPLFLGVLIGYWIDKKFETKPFFVVLGIIFGVIGVSYNFWKITKSIK